MRIVCVPRARYLRALVAVWLVVLVGAGAAVASGGPVGTEPAPGAYLRGGPSALRLQFSAPLEPYFLVLQLWQDTRVSSLPARIDPTDPDAVIATVPRNLAPPGTAWVRWRVLTGDGHVSGGHYAVEIGRASSVSPPPPALTSPFGGWIAGIGRLLVLVGLVAALGLVVLRWGVAGPAWQAGGVVGPGRPDDRSAFRDRTMSTLATGARTWWHAWWGALAAWLAGALMIAVGTAWWVGDGVSGLGVIVAHTRVGHAADALVVAGLCAAAASRLLRGRAGADTANPPLGWGVAMGVWAAAGIGLMSWVGHASDGTDVTINIAADALHGVASAAWLGGLLGLLVLVVGPGQRLAEGDRVRLLAAAVVRFSSMAIFCVAVLAITGTYRALAELSSLSQLVTTEYGIALCVKLGIFGVMLAAGGYSRIILHPRLERAALGLDPHERGASRALRTSLRVELALAAALMVSVAVLLAATPPG